MNHCSQWKYRVRFLWGTGHGIFVKWLIYNLVLGVWLKDTLIKTYCWSINVNFTVNKQHNNSAWMKLSNTHIFFKGTSYSSYTKKHYLGAILNSEITKKNHKEVKNMALNRLWKGRLVSVWKLKQENRTSLVWYRLGICILNKSNFSLSYACWQMTISDTSIDLGFSKMFSELAYLHMQTLEILRMNCTSNSRSFNSISL